MIDWEEAKQFFLEASAATYAANVDAGTIVELPGSKVLTFRKGNLSYIDEYFANKRIHYGLSSGITIMHMHQYDLPIWAMNYSGWWRTDDKRIIPFLKRALMEAYGKGEFISGRGPIIFYESEDEDALVYTNHPIDLGQEDYQKFTGNRNDFCCFAGMDAIHQRNDPFGYFRYKHNYSGMALMP